MYTNTEQPSRSISFSHDSEQIKTKNVEILTGDPKKAIVALALPMIIAMMLSSLYNVVNAIWVAGLGSDALAAVGIVTPVFMIIMGIGVGIGTGATSAIARKIGAGDKQGADNTAVHALLINITLGIILTVIGYIFLADILLFMGAGELVPLALEYGHIIILGTVLFLFSNIMYGILRGEGDAKRPMYAMVISSILNIILDPFLIYTCNMGIAGAAWGTIISILFIVVLYTYWIFIKRDTYLRITRAAFTYQNVIIFDILKVGLPASVEFIAMAIMSLFINWILISTDGANAVAIFTGGWRVIMIAMVPLIAIGTAVTAVAGAMYGAKRFGELKAALVYGSKLGIGISIIIAVVTFIAAPSISYLFAYSEGGEHILSSMSDFLRVMVLIYPFAAIGITASCVFQGVGKGFTALALNVMRSLIFICVLSYILGIVFDLKSVGVWWGVILGDILGGVLGFCIALYFTSALIKYNSMAKERIDGVE